LSDICNYETNNKKLKKYYIFKLFCKFGKFENLKIIFIFDIVNTNLFKGNILKIPETLFFRRKFKDHKNYSSSSLCNPANKTHKLKNSSISFSSRARSRKPVSPSSSKFTPLYFFSLFIFHKK